MPAAPDRIHATAIAYDNASVLIRGPSGSGKSDLALRCLALAPSTLCPGTIALVADDQVHLFHDGPQLLARAPAVLRGKLEVRGLGIVTLPVRDDIPVRLVADLVQPAAVERLPKATQTTVSGVVLPQLLITPFEHSAPAKLLLALMQACPPRV